MRHGIPMYTLSLDAQVSASRGAAVQVSLRPGGGELRASAWGADARFDSTPRSHGAAAGLLTDLHARRYRERSRPHATT